jgi:hypothetical protein
VFIHGGKNFFQALGRGMKHNTAHAITLLKSKKYTFLIVRGRSRACILIIDDEWQGWRIDQHIRYRGTIRAQKMQTQVRW